MHMHAHVGLTDLPKKAEEEEEEKVVGVRVLYGPTNSMRDMTVIMLMRS